LAAGSRVATLVVDGPAHHLAEAGHEEAPLGRVTVLRAQLFEDAHRISPATHLPVRPDQPEAGLGRPTVIRVLESLPRDLLVFLGCPAAGGGEVEVEHGRSE